MNSFPSFATDGGGGSASAAHSNSDAIYYSDPQVLAAVQEAKASKPAKVSLTSVPTSKDEQPAHQEQGDDSAPHSFKRFAPPPNMILFSVMLVPPLP